MLIIKKQHKFKQSSTSRSLLTAQNIGKTNHQHRNTRAVKVYGADFAFGVCI
ncbi:hypothetical protein [Microcoleus sp. herbarium14]|uniref:hypothetical protein n=1 Tax=Microcoleus sp. herbarium14 TaxID=3055439 RepID=UPI002FD30E3F